MSREPSTFRARVSLNFDGWRAFEKLQRLAWKRVVRVWLMNSDFQCYALFLFYRQKHHVNKLDCKKHQGITSSNNGTLQQNLNRLNCYDEIYRICHIRYHRWVQTRVVNITLCCEEIWIRNSDREVILILLCDKHCWICIRFNIYGHQFEFCIENFKSATPSLMCL